MDEYGLGILERVDLRSIWPSEAQDFTRWLSMEKNLDALGKALNLNLCWEASEKNVGPFPRSSCSETPSACGPPQAASTAGLALSSKC